MRVFPRSVLAALLLALPPAPAGAQIVLPGTQPGELVEPLLDSTICSICHGDHDGSAAYEPWETWSGSMMANSARDPLFWAAVDIANQDVPGAGEFCIRCHSPRGWLGGRSAVPDGSGLEGIPGAAGGDFEGIDCHFCHRAYEGPTGTPYLENGQYWVDVGAATGMAPMRGPYADATAPHAWTYSAHHVSSEFCAVCHDLGNPLVNLKDANGVDLGIPFPEQTTYTEWAASSFPDDGVQCQTCHMPDAAGWVCSDFDPYRTDIAKHELAGANVWMSTVLRDLYGTALDRVAAFDRAINLSLDQLQNRSATLALGVPSRLAGSGEVTATVRVTNLTGHKLPTGYPEGRRMWIQVTARDASGGVLYETGRYDDATAELIADPDLVVYETRHGVHGEGPTFHLVRNDRIFLDNRIPPAGFVPEPRTEPVGRTYPVLPDGSLAHWDERDFPIVVPDGTAGPVTVTASLWYQTASRGYVEFLRDENVSGPDPLDPDPMAPSRGEKIHALWEASGRSAPVLMRSVTRRVLLDRPLPATHPAPEPPTVPRLSSPEPNPFRDRTSIAFSIPEGGDVRLAVFDVAGRRVRELRSGPVAAGEHRAGWDGNDGAGRAAAAGSYFVRLEAPGVAPLVQRVLLLR